MLAADGTCQYGCHRQSPARLNPDTARVIQQLACTLHEFVADRTHSHVRPFQDLKRVRPNLTRAQRITYCIPRRLDPDRHPGLTGARIALVGFRLDNVDRCGDRSRTQGKGHTRSQSAAAARHDNSIRVGAARFNFDCYLGTQGMASRNHLDIFEGVQLTPAALPSFHTCAVDQFRPLGDFYLSSGLLCLVSFESRNVTRHDQASRLVESLSSQTNRDREISCTGSDNAVLGVSYSQDCPSKFERSAALHSLVLDADRPPELRVQHGRRSDRRPQRMACDKLAIIGRKIEGQPGYLHLSGICQRAWTFIRAICIRV